MNIKISDQFKKNTAKTLFAIFIFITVYILLLFAALILTLLSIAAGLSLIILKPMLITLALGAGLVSMSVIVLIFLLKFLFNKHKVDDSHLTYITWKNEPKLFEFISKIATEAETEFPKKIYLSNDVNAAVFYDSSFWSMFFPVKKNLQIGIGLVNSISVSELKGILGHEFGHFSQKSMKVGSYVYNVNQIIYNMLFDDESFNKLTQKWAEFSNTLSWFVLGAIKIISGIRLILQKMYEFVNLNYMALSREMEFNADEISAHISGPNPLITALLRTNLSDHAYNTVLNYYDNKIANSIRSKNIYRDHQFVLTFLAEENNIEIKNGFPEVTLDHINRFNKSKLNIRNQWASHPGIEERVNALKKLNLPDHIPDNSPASALFTDFEATQIQVTEKLFNSITFNELPIEYDTDSFKNEYIDKYRENVFANVYCSYYDDKDPEIFNLDDAIEVENPYCNSAVHQIFNNGIVDRVYEKISLEGDLDILNKILKKEYVFKSYDYDGIKYSWRETSELINSLNDELIKLKNEIRKHDIYIFNFYYQKSKGTGSDKTLIEKYIHFFKSAEKYPTYLKTYSDLVQSTAFFQFQTPVEQIVKNMSMVNKAEKEFKLKIKSMLDDEIYLNLITPDIRTHFNNFIEKNFFYFLKTEYDNDALNILMMSMNYYYQIVSNTHFKLKKDLLDFQTSLIQN